MLAPALLIAALAALDDDAFERQIRPILAERCLKCHGEDKPKGGLRLTSRGSILKGGDSGPSAVAGKSAESALIQALHYVDDPKMPPTGKLPDAEIATLSRWVDAGMPWPEAAAPKPEPAGKPYTITEEQRQFWSFRPIGEPKPPKVVDESWPRRDLDRFILARLEAAGLKPAPPADKRTLIRRATFDLTGLPPTPGEIAAFLADDTPASFGKVLDRLLASPRYGERWGRHWLDVVRYADSRDARGVGGDADIGEAWRYRDWVVKAFNDDRPYDRMIVDQIAGDLLPDNPDGTFNAEGLVATGLLAIGEWGAGDADKEKMITDIVDDQVDVVGRAFMGLTVACARCHDHKFDPIPTADYYAMAGMFFSTHIIPGPGDKSAGSPMLRTPIASKAQLAAVERHRKRTAEVDKAITAEADARSAELAARLLPSTSALILAAWDRQSSAATSTLPEFAVRRWSTALGLSAEGRPVAGSTANLFGIGGVTGWSDAADGPSMTINANPKDLSVVTFTLPAHSVSVHPSPTKAAVVAWRSPIGGTIAVEGVLADSDPNCGDGVAWAVSWCRGLSARPLAAGDLANGGRQDLKQGGGGDRLARVEVRPGDVIRLAVAPKDSYSCDTTHVRLKIKATDGPTWDLADDLTAGGLDNPHPDRQGHPAVWTFAEGDPGAGRQDLPTAEYRALTEAVAGGDRAAIEAVARGVQAEVDRPGSRLAAALIAPGGPLRASATELPAEAGSNLARLRAERDQLRSTVPAPFPVALAAQDGGVPRSGTEAIGDARVHVRGSYRRLGEVVPRRFPRVVAGDAQPPITSGSGRLELARWVARPDHPLTPRVMVNRIWQHHLGEGIVRTPSNYGKLGERPSHPELLDHLARKFVDGGWSIKAMHREIMLSSTYQQSSTSASESRRLDPDNRLYGRANRRRLEAEAIRDALLSASGRLDPTMGGPSTRDFAGPRRTLYFMTIRSDRSSFGPLFDAADAAAVVDRRTSSTVAPQALFLLNNPFAVDQAAALGKRVSSLPGDDRSRIAAAYEILYARPPTGAEVAVGLDLLGDARDWSSYCHMLLCANEMIYID